jgi:hypothetical protein
MGGIDIQKEADKIVLNKYSPPALSSVNMDIIQFRGNISPHRNPHGRLASSSLDGRRKPGNGD